MSKNPDDYSPQTFVCAECRTVNTVAVGHDPETGHYFDEVAAGCKRCGAAHDLPPAFGLPVNATIEDLYRPAMAIRSEEVAGAYMRKLVLYSRVVHGRWEDTDEDLVEIHKSNLGYYAGYFSDEVRERVERCFSCAHPIFGSIEEQGSPSPREAFEAGVRWSQRRGQEQRE